MCQLASFFHNPINGDIEIYDLTSHSKTKDHLNLNEKIWREGHYLPDGTIECRTVDSDRTSSEKCNDRMKNRFPKFVDFFNWSVKKDCVFSESLYLRGCDLKGITLPTTISGYLDLSGCDLKGITLPTSIGGSLHLRGCDLKGITLPTSIGCYLDLSGCDLKGITLPTSICGSLDLRGCDLKGITLPTTIGGSLDLSGCDLKGITLPTSIGGSLHLSGNELGYKEAMAQFNENKKNGGK
jgi:uncharacterized protein YjbI with pentapeptide repeats